ncbi:HAMP domain-containing methyl-accepting chemotaxis protein [Thiosulfativibrio zosterae]|uniref:Methyl-accepting chemotaxis protein n=1 Tax=Thiosulfativibrio zosterae TaxID=2675053 RepID=A0A6F8PR50_9GAMM|nr:methyl-accepting chemotaxis protein [Thiosulfativibrio zosterae]BBP44601.1 methyl-accepting chemotaxis protein [Thiosulfativibrio zosterae]
MAWFYHLSIRTKLLSLIGLLLVLMGIIGFMGLNNTSKVNDMADEMYQKELLGLSYIKEANIDLLYQSRAVRNFLLAQTDASIDQSQYLDALKKYQDLFDEHIKKAEPLFYTAAAKQKFAELNEKGNQFEAFTNRVIELAQSEKASGAVQEQERQTIKMALIEGRQLADSVDNAMTALTELKEQNAAAASVASTQLYEQSKLMMTAVLLGALLLGLVIGLMVSGRIKNNVEGLVKQMGELVKTQNLSLRMPKRDDDETGDIAEALNGLLETFAKGIDETQSVVEAIAKADYQKRIVGQYQGDLLELKDGVNASAESVSFMMDELSKVMDALHNGKFDIKMDKRVPKGFSKQVEDALSSINQVVIEINVAMQEMNQGDFEGEITVDARGALLSLKNNINGSLKNMAMAISAISEVVEAQAAGDLTKELPSGTFKGQLHDLKNAINYSSAKVREVVQVAIEASQVVSGAAQEVSQGSLDLSQSVQEQAAALEQTSATMNEMNSQVQSSSANAKEATNVAKTVQKKAHDGVGVMRQTITAMTAIEESSHKISDIVSLIDGIAFQTNLLALNAAVEAARAGDHGRGFAVVAGEVRNLAQKSAEAAKDIKVLIDETVQRVGQGSRLATESGDMLNDINTSIESVTKMMDEIAQAAAEQADGVHQVHQAITQIDGVTQQNAALVEETSAASESLSEQARLLQKEMSFFRIGAHSNASYNSQSKAAVKTPALAAPKAAVKPVQKQPGLVKNTPKLAAPAPKALSAKSQGNSDEWGEF